MRSNLLFSVIYCLILHTTSFLVPMKFTVSQRPSSSWLPMNAVSPTMGDFREDELLTDDIKSQMLVRKSKQSYEKRLTKRIDANKLRVRRDLFSGAKSGKLSPYVIDSRTGQPYNWNPYWTKQHNKQLQEKELMAQLNAQKEILADHEESIRELICGKGVSLEIACRSLSKLRKKSLFDTSNSSSGETISNHVEKYEKNWTEVPSIQKSLLIHLLEAEMEVRSELEDGVEGGSDRAVALIEKASLLIEEYFKNNDGKCRRCDKVLFHIKLVNKLIRFLGKANHLFGVSRAISLLRESTDKDPSKLCVPNGDMETFEFVANAYVKTIEFEVECKAMSDMPLPTKRQLSEIVFIGRSNVGKSSLVNMLCGRKALASTSEQPGHTKSFHFYHVNKGWGQRNYLTIKKKKTVQNRTESSGIIPSENTAEIQSESLVEKKRHVVSGIKHVPEFRIIDVPGLGFALNATEAVQTSWRVLIDRYLHVRESLNTVAHLVDAKTGIQRNDTKLMEIVSKAITNRTKPFNYLVVLTKVDKVSAKLVEERVKEIKQCLLYFNLLNETDHQDTSENLNIQKSAASALIKEPTSILGKKVRRESRKQEDKEQQSQERRRGAHRGECDGIILTSSRSKPPIGRDVLWHRLWGELMNEPYLT